MAIDQIVSASIADDAVTNAKVSYNNNQFRNIIINGDMSQAQRSTSVSGITGTDSGYKTLDRFYTEISSAGTWTQSQSTDVPSGQGFAKSLKMDCTTAAASPTFLSVETYFEGQNLQYIKKGTSSAESTTLSFWVKSSKTGTHIAELRDYDNNRTISQSYTISSADTWEKKTLTYAGDTSGSLGNDNGKSLGVTFFLAVSSTYSSGTLATSWESRTNANRAVGQVNLADSTSNEWYITGAQLEVGTSASDFEFLPTDVNLQRCRRYYQVLIPSSGANNGLGIGFSYSTSQFQVSNTLNPVMRSTPTIDYESGSYYQVQQGSGDVASTTLATNISSEFLMHFNVTGGTYQGAGTAGVAFASSNSAFVAFSSEL